MKYLFSLILFFCGILVATERLATGVVSVQQVLDDGRVAMIAPGEGKKAPYLAGYLVSSFEKAELFPCEPVPNLFNFSWEAKSISGTSDGMNFWCISLDQIGTDLYQNKLHCLGESGFRSPQFEGQRIFVGECEDSVAFVLVYQPGKVQLGWLQGMSFTVIQEVSLPDDTGLQPAVSADCQVLYYLRDEKDHTVMLCKADVQTSEIVALENLGERTELGVYAGEYRKDVQAVSCSRDGSVVAYHYVDGIRGLQLRMGTLRGDNAFVAQTVTTEGGGEPRLVANGRFLVYVADNVLWRYDSHSQTCKRVSSEECVVTTEVAISPDGGWCAWVDAAKVLWREHFDACVALEAQRLQVPSASSNVDCGLGISGASAENSISWKCLDETGFSGRFFSQTTGEEILPDVFYAVNTLPWKLQTGEQSGKYKVQFVLDNGDVEELELLVSDFTNLTPWLPQDKGTDDFFYKSLHFPTEKEVYMLTNSPLLPSVDKGSSVDGYAIDFEKMKYSRQLADVSLDDLVVSLGKVNYRVSQTTGALLRNEEVLLPDGVSTEESLAISQNGHLAVIQNGALLYSADDGTTFIQLAENAANPKISADGMVLAWVSQDALFVRSGDNAEIRKLQDGVSALCGMTQNGEYFLFQNAADGGFAMVRCDKSDYMELKGMPQTASNVRLSANGRRVLFEAKEDEKDKMRIYALNWKDSGAGAVCLTPKAVQGMREAAINSSAHYVTFSTYADMEVEGIQLAENGQCNLYLWADHGWKNSAPVIINTQLAEVLEDSSDTNLRLSTTDADDDATVTTIVEAPLHGTAYLLPPDQTSFVYRLYYTPEKDFSGVDTIGLRLSDGCETVTRTLTIPVKNVNDPPEWDPSTPTAVTLAVGELLQVPLLAHDVDLDNPTPDHLEYSLVGEESDWCAVFSADNLGTLQLTPGWEQLGVQSVTVQVSDGMVAVPWTIQVAVEAPSAVKISAELLLDPSLAPLEPKSSAERLQAYVAGCWEELVESEWQLLSLPAEADVASLCQLLGTTEIVIYDAQEGYRFRKDGVLPAGEGFWVRPQAAPTGELVLQPASRVDFHYFCGPVWQERMPEGKRLEVKEEAWQSTDAWQVGKAYFLPPFGK